MAGVTTHGYGRGLQLLSSYTTGSLLVSYLTFTSVGRGRPSSSTAFLLARILLTTHSPNYGDGQQQSCWRPLRFLHWDRIGARAFINVAAPSSVSFFFTIMTGQRCDVVTSSGRDGVSRAKRTAGSTCSREPMGFVDFPYTATRAGFSPRWRELTLRRMPL